MTRPLVTITMLALWLNAALAANETGKLVYDKAAPTVVFISSPTGGASRTGSGVLIRQDEILTNCHVVQSATEIAVTFHDGERKQGTFAGRYGNLDLCSVRVSTGSRKASKLGKIKDVRAGQAVFALGSPLGLQASISDGIVASLRDTDGLKLIQLTAPISPGSSGGGLFDDNATLIGITTSSYTAGQNVNFAIPIDYATLLTRSLVASDKQLTAPNVSFKGLPFGVSKDTLLQEFPGLACQSMDAGLVTCSGRTDFIGRPANFTAMVGSRGLFLVNIQISSDDPEEAFSDAVMAIAERFKLPTKFQPGRFVNWDIGGRNEQGLILIKCDRLNRCKSDATLLGVELTIADARLAKPKGQDF